MKIARLCLFVIGVRISCIMSSGAVYECDLARSLTSRDSSISKIQIGSSLTPLPIRTILIMT